MNVITPEHIKSVQGLAPQTTATAKAGDYISLKNAISLRVEVDLTQAAGHATVITVHQATAVAATGEKAISKAVQIWANEDVAAGDTLVRQTDAVSYTVTDDIKNKKIVFHILHQHLDMNNSFDCVCVKLSASSQATNFAAITYLVDTVFNQETPPSAIVD